MIRLNYFLFDPLNAKSDYYSVLGLEEIPDKLRVLIDQ